MKALEDLFLAKSAGMPNAGRHILKAPPKLAKVTTCRDLQQALLLRLYEIEGEATKLEQVLKSFAEKVKRKSAGRPSSC